MIRVLNVYKDKPTPGARMCRIMRGSSSLGNPFVIGRDGDRTEVIAKYEQWLIEKLRDNESPVAIEFYNLVQEATEQDIDLVCCCKPQACHGDVLKSVVEQEIEKLYADYEAAQEDHRQNYGRERE
jgi:hypothetical protein